MGRFRRAAPDVVAAGLVAAAVVLVVGHVFPNFDYFYALVWGRDLIQGRAPDYAAPFAPAAHPLVNAVAAFANVLGNSVAVDLMRFSGPLALGALCVGLFRLGQQLFGWPVGLLAAVLTATREPMLLAAARGYLDVPSTALIVWAAVLEARRQRRGAPVFVLLAIAGLLRPEAWLLAGAYFLWMAADRAWSDRIRFAALAAAGPVLWLLSDFWVTGDPFLRFHVVELSISERSLGYPFPTTRTGLLAVPDALARDFGNFMRLGPLLLAVAGFVLGMVWFRRQMVLPALIAALNSSAFVVLGVSGVVIEQRYLFPSAVMLTLFAALLAVGWITMGSTERRRAWVVAGSCGVVVLLASVLSAVRRIDDARSTLAAQNDAETALYALIQRRSAARLIRRARVVLLQTPTPLPLLAFWTGKAPDVFTTDPTRPDAPSAFLAAQNPTTAEYLTQTPTLPPSSTTPPPGYRRAVVTTAWTLYERP